jgi:hypothetical protein
VQSRILRTTGSALACLAAAGLTLLCGRPSEEARIRAFLDKTVSLAEKKDLAGVMSRLAEDYSDFEGRDKAATGALVSDYFRRTGIVIHLLAVHVTLAASGNQASAEAEAYLSSGAGEVFRRLARVAGECYRFEVRLVPAPGPGWQVVWARWESVPEADLFPESLARLRKLFPGF